ncbi:MAG: GNAT family N-acetyltransferase [Chloroflexi bacterium]|nr:GNAT family N-acetyltransferase [Chloroflexota bacterium]
MHLEPASLTAPRGLAELLADLGNGENGFNGTAVGRGEMAIPEYLQSCMDMTDASKLKPGFVPQTVFWIIDDAGEAVGLVRVRHYLNDKLRERGGHIGYYIRPSQRGKGYATQALRLALVEIRKLGEPRAMLSTNETNLPSRRVIEVNGGVLDGMGLNEDGTQFCRYWIEIDT